MAILGGILLVVGVILLFVWRHYQRKLRGLSLARTTTVAELIALVQQVAQEIGGGSLHQFVKLKGKICCDAPLQSELKQVPCVYYSMQVIREYEEQVTERDSDGETRQETRRGSETIANNSQSVPFILRDRSGEIRVEPEGANLETIQVLNEFDRDRDTRAKSSTAISYGGFRLDLGDWTGGNRRTLGYRYVEAVLPVDRQVLIVGTASDANGDLSLHKPTEPDQPFIISLQSEEGLTQATRQAANYSFYGMIASLSLGVPLLILGLLKR
jgi:E3 Ubiquitin ligase